MVPEPPAPSPSVLTTADDVRAALLELSDESKAAQVARYLRAVPGGYGEGDRFHGVPVPHTRAVARRAVLDDGELERLVASPWHEERIAALCVAVAQAKRISRLLGSRRAQQDPVLDDPHDLIHKAVGWMLREAGKRVDEGSLVAFLDRYAARMPRTMLRYAIERLSPEVRAHYRSLRA
ncbi:DNA alkylation repair protein [Actinomyces viscosus]|uniref:DNA alkylation repair protein n=1 Tax=Actinomyces viscosus TaxID=1656 RepID=UPI0028F06F36|nr:DNA alkylation repair protein [Actinomyces viscosus]